MGRRGTHGRRPVAAHPRHLSTWAARLSRRSLFCGIPQIACRHSTLLPYWRCRPLTAGTTGDRHMGRIAQQPEEPVEKKMRRKRPRSPGVDEPARSWTGLETAIPGAPPPTGGSGAVACRPEPPRRGAATRCRRRGVGAARRRCRGGRPAPWLRHRHVVFQCGPEFDGCDEEGAGFADGLEVTIQLDRASTVAVAQHAPVHLRAQLAHLTALVLGRQLRRLLIERLDLLGNLEILVRDRSIGDFRINLRHRKILMPQQRGDRFHAHAPVHGLGREGGAACGGACAATAPPI
jgi:hypothetical protein